MEITGKVLLIETNATIKGQNGNYQGTELTYKDSEGLTKSKAFHVNALKFNAALNNGLNNLSPGDEFTAVLEKKDSFWNWMSISKGTNAVSNTTPSKPVGSASTSAPMSKSTPSTYATAEERAQTQKYIVRQSSITAALKLLEIQGKKTVDQFSVISLAEQFTAWVMGESTQVIIDDIADMEDDIPL